MIPIRPTAVLLAQVALLAPLLAQSFNRSLLPREDGSVRRAGGPRVDAVARARLGVVNVVVEVSGRNSFRIERPGSGVVLSADGLIVTLDSLVREAVDASDKQVFVVVPDQAKTRLGAKIVARATALDLALLKVDPGPDTSLVAVPMVPLADPGEPAIVYGFPDGEDAIAFTGVVSQAAGAVRVEDGAVTLDFPRESILLTDAAIQRRCHGAALLSADGGLLGICNASRVRAEVSEPSLEELKRPSFGFVISASLIRTTFAKELVTVPVPGRRVRTREATAAGRVADAVVGVFGGTGQRPQIGPDDPFAKQRRDGVGSGVVVDPSGLVLTDKHLVAAAEEIHVTLRNGDSYSAELLAADSATNSALLRVRLPAGRRLTSALWAASASVAVGDPVLAIGNPEGHASMVGDGVVSARRGESIQFDAPAGNQNAGGALVTLDGELIGIIDGGAIDKIDVAFAQRGDQAKVETSLNLAPGTDRLLAVYGDKLVGVTRASAHEAGNSHVAGVVAQAGIAMLNVYVEITTKAADEEDNPFAASKPRTFVEGLGSGVVIDGSGLALTNWHVVDSATEPDGSTRADHVVRVARRDGRVFPAQVLSISREEDLALLQLDLEPGENIPAVELGASSILEVGDATIAIGNPFGRANTVTFGVVSAKNQSIRVKGRWAKLPHLLETDAAINAGNSGGALLDYDGRLIGINSAGGSFHNVTGFAIAVDHVREKVHSLLLSPEKLRSPYLGLLATDSEGSVVVHSVAPNGPAAAAGLVAGDVIRSFGGADVAWSVGFAMQLLRAPAQLPVDLVFEHEHRSVEKKIEPWSAGQWAMCRQTGVLARTMSFREDPALVQEVSIAFYRGFTGDPEAAPASTAQSLVRVVRLLPTLAPPGTVLQPEDFLLGVQLDEDHDTGVAGRLIRFETVEDVQRCFDANSTYNGRKFTAWIARGKEVTRVELSAKRLIL